MAGLDHRDQSSSSGYCTCAIGSIESCIKELLSSPLKIILVPHVELQSPTGNIGEQLSLVPLSHPAEVGGVAPNLCPAPNFRARDRVIDNYTGNGIRNVIQTCHAMHVTYIHNLYRNLLQPPVSSWIHAVRRLCDRATSFYRYYHRY